MQVLLYGSPDHRLDSKLQLFEAVHAYYIAATNTVKCVTLFCQYFQTGTTLYFFLFFFFCFFLMKFV